MSIEKRGENKYRFRTQYKKIKYTTNWEGEEEQAKIMHDLFVAEVKAGKYKKQAEQLQAEKSTLGYVWDLYLKSKELEANTVSNHKFARKKFTSILNTDISTITKQSMLEYYLNHKEKSNCENEYRILAQIFNFAVSLDIIEKNPIGFKLKKNKKEKFIEIISEDEIKKLISAIQSYKNPLLRCIYLLQITTGARISEVLGLTKESVNMDAHTLYIKQQFKLINAETGEYGKGKTKTKSSIREIFIPSLVRPYLYEIVLDAKDNDYLFKHSGKVISYDSANRNLKNLCEKTNIKELSTHKLRNLYTTIAYYSKVSPLTISKNLGHTTMNMTEHYLSSINAKTQAESQKIDDFFFELPEKLPEIK